MPHTGSSTRVNHRVVPRSWNDRMMCMAMRGCPRACGCHAAAATALLAVPSSHRFRLDLYTLRGYMDFMRQEIKSSCLKRLKRIEGQVRGLAGMVEDDRYCIDVVTQIAAARAALRRVEEEILRDHVAHCVEHAIHRATRPTSAGRLRS